MLFLEDLNTMTDSQSDISEDLRTHPPVVPAAGKQAVNRRLSTDSQNSESSTAHRLYNLDQKVVEQTPVLPNRKGELQPLPATIGSRTISVFK